MATDFAGIRRLKLTLARTYFSFFKKRNKAELVSKAFEKLEFDPRMLPAEEEPEDDALQECGGIVVPSFFVRNARHFPPWTSKDAAHMHGGAC